MSTFLEEGRKEKNPKQTTNPNQKCAKNMACRWLFLFCFVWGSHRSRISYQGGISLLQISAESLYNAASTLTSSQTHPACLTHFWYRSYPAQCQLTLCRCELFTWLDTTAALIQTCRQVPGCKDVQQKSNGPSLWLRWGRGMKRLGREVNSSRKKNPFQLFIRQWRVFQLPGC